MSENEMNMILTAEELDAIGEIMNISMGAAATAVSTMLEKQVSITTPHLEQNEFRNIDNSQIEPALIVKIKYTEGISGINTTMLKRQDVQLILDILMGNDMPSEDDVFEFDDMSMSAACEVMNQMMGSSATALSEMMNMTVNISTPEAILVENTAEAEETFLEMRGDQPVVAISFNMAIKDVLDTNFMSFLPIELAREIIGRVNEHSDQIEPTPVIDPEPPKVIDQNAFASQNQFSEPQYEHVSASQAMNTEQQIPFNTQNMNMPYVEPQMAQPSVDTTQNSIKMDMGMPQSAPSMEGINNQAMPNMQGAPNMQSAPNMQNPQNAGMPPMGDYQNVAAAYQQQMNYMPPNGYNPQYMPPNGYNPQYMGHPGTYNYPPGYNPNAYAQGGYVPEPVAVRKPEFPDFSQMNMQGVNPSSSNMNLLMGVQLEISVVVGKAKRKIKDIMDFGQGTVVELDKQTGAPAEIVVNGQLLAYGDVIVVGDNFGVRITEIVGSKELIDLLSNN